MLTLSKLCSATARKVVALAAVSLLALSASPVLAQSGGETIYALTKSNSLLRIPSNAPSVIQKTIPVVGLPVGETLVAVDYRPCRCGLYALSTSGAIYAINLTSGVATREEGTAPFIAAGNVDIDYHPTSDTLHVTAQDGTNGRMKVNHPFSIMHSRLSFAAGDSSSGTPAVGGTAFSDNAEGQRSTTLYGIDASRDILVTIGDKDEATVNSTAGKVFTVGSLGLNVRKVLGFDIGAPETANAFAVFQLEGESASKLFSVNLSTGAASYIGTLGTSEEIEDITIGLGGDIVFAQSSMTIKEGDPVKMITVDRVGGSAGTPSATYEIVGGSAVEGKDFQKLNNSVYFPAGQTRMTFGILVYDDKIDEFPETIVLRLVEAHGGAVVGLQDQIVITIVDNDKSEVEGSGELITSPVIAPLSMTVGAPAKLKAVNALRKGITLQLQCSGPCSVHGQLLLARNQTKALRLTRAKAGIVGGGSTQRADGSPGRLTLKFARSAAKALSSQKKFSVTARVRALDANGQGVLSKKKITVVR